MGIRFTSAYNALSRFAVVLQEMAVGVRSANPHATHSVQWLLWEYWVG
jgi:hypothetical protein